MLAMLLSLLRFGRRKPEDALADAQRAVERAMSELLSASSVALDERSRLDSRIDELLQMATEARKRKAEVEGVADRAGATHEAIEKALVAG